MTGCPGQAAPAVSAAADGPAAPATPATPDDSGQTPGLDARRRALTLLARYFRSGSHLVAALPMPCLDRPVPEPLPPRLEMVDLPAFAARAAAAGGLLVPAWTVAQGEGPAWRRVDWLSAAAWYLDGAAERAFEAVHGPIHSYSFRLAGWDQRLWDHAWVNRIGLFLRLWAAHEAGLDAGLDADLVDNALGPLPAPAVHLTHDVDYLRKTLAVRAKQGAFEGFKALRAARQGDWAGFQRQAARGLRFMFSQADYQLCLHVADLVAGRGARSSFFFYGGRGGLGGGLLRPPALQLIDPGYDVAEPRWSALLRELDRRGFGVGLHQSYGSWGQPGPGEAGGAQAMRREKQRVEAALGRPVTACRQHWLRFSWRDTWQAQARAGLTLDTTLGFNDRPGFRNGCALAFTPLDTDAGRELPLTALPMLFMDSHFFDYAGLKDEERRAELSRWLGEVRAVGGEISALWHPYVLSPDFGRAELFGHLLDQLEGFETRVDLAVKECQ